MAYERFIKERRIHKESESRTRMSSRRILWRNIPIVVINVSVQQMAHHYWQVGVFIWLQAWKVIFLPLSYFYVFLDLWTNATIFIFLFIFYKVTSCTYLNNRCPFHPTTRWSRKKLEKNIYLYFIFRVRARCVTFIIHQQYPSPFRRWSQVITALIPLRWKWLIPFALISLLRKAILTRDFKSLFDTVTII